MQDDQRQRAAEIINARIPGVVPPEHLEQMRHIAIYPAPSGVGVTVAMAQAAVPGSGMWAIDVGTFAAALSEEQARGLKGALGAEEIAWCSEPLNQPDE
jgi:hypothetical protein